MEKPKEELSRCYSLHCNKLYFYHLTLSSTVEFQGFKYSGISPIWLTPVIYIYFFITGKRYIQMF